ncbi:hypothetical protein MPSEU_000488000 [Mayamaea pseudoterrestris]|nr:hypothetical protein MPSEU_000488000 [Mayamaea pseudoterrestris]
MKRANSNLSSGNNNVSSSSSKPWFSSYQSGGYQPPVHYASDQTHTLQDTAKTYYQTDETANNVLQKMTIQRSQLQSAHGSVHEMQQATAAARRQIEELQRKNRQKKQRLRSLLS